MWNIKNLFSPTPKDLGYCSGVKICELIKDYWLTAVVIIKRNNIYKNAAIMIFNIMLIYFTYRAWVVIKRKCAKRKRFLQVEWNKELEKTRLEMHRALIREIKKNEADQPEDVREYNIQLAITLADRKIDRYLKEYEENFRRKGIDDGELVVVKEMNVLLKQHNDNIEAQRAARTMRGAPKANP